MPEHAKVQPPLRYIPPRFRPRLYRLIMAFYPVYLRLALNIRRVKVEGIDTLVDHYRRFQDRKIRLIIAFRHPHVDDGAIMAWLVGGMVSRAARGGDASSGKLRRYPFAFFVYDRGAPLWAGALIGWLLPRMGGVSIFRGKLDSASFSEIRRLLADGEHPVAIAPEGAVSYSEREAAPLETGVAHFAFWCVKDLDDAARKEQVIIVPVTPSYQHGQDAERGLHRIAAFLERECGIQPDPEQSIPARLRRAAHVLLRMTEDFYRRFYPTASAMGSSGSESSAPRSNHAAAMGQAAPSARGESDFAEPNPERIEAIVEAALSSAERQLGLEPVGEAIPRVRRIEQACWDRIYREDIPDIEALAPLERALADRVALETSLTMRHLQLADILVYLSNLEIPDGSSPDELAEVSSNLAGVVSRLTGGDISSTPRMGSRSITFRIGTPIAVTERWSAYCENRTRAVDELMESLRAEFERLISAQ